MEPSQPASSSVFGVTPPQRRVVGGGVRCRRRPSFFVQLIRPLYNGLPIPVIGFGLAAFLET
ncbi:hypothetical protein LXL04_024544 [Taraxacum kok-saghyz]